MGNRILQKFPFFKMVSVGVVKLDSNCIFLKTFSVSGSVGRLEKTSQVEFDLVGTGLYWVGADILFQLGSITIGWPDCWVKPPPPRAKQEATTSSPPADLVCTRGTKI